MNDSNEMLLNVLGVICWIAAIIIIGSSFIESKEPVAFAVEEIDYVMPNGKTAHCFVYIDPKNKSKRRVPVSCEYKS